MKKTSLLILLLLVIPTVMVMATDYSVYYDYSSNSYQCVNPSFTVQYVNNKPTCGGIYYNQSSAQNECLGAHQSYSAGDCVCDFGWVKQSDGTCAAAQTTNPLSEGTSAENSYQYSISNCAASGGEWESTYCDCPAGCSAINNVCVAIIPTMSDLCTGSSSSSGSGSIGSGVTSGSTTGGGSSTISSNYNSGNSGGGQITLPTVTSTGVLTNPIASGSFADLLNRIIDWILNIALVLAPLVIVYGGFIYMTAAGDTNKVSQGKNIVLYAVIGFIVALLAKSLIGIFKDLVVK